MPGAWSNSCSWTGFSRGPSSTRCGWPSTASTSCSTGRTTGSAPRRKLSDCSGAPAASWSSCSPVHCWNHWRSGWRVCRRPAMTSEKRWRCSTSTPPRGWRGTTQGTTGRWSSRKGNSEDERSREERNLMWRLRVVHSTGYAYKSPVTASFNEARLTPRSDGRQNVILNRVETVPATRSYRYVDYWGTAVTAFDLHAPHTELEVTGSSVVETELAEKPEELAGWDDLRTEAVVDRFDEVLSPTHYTPYSKRIARV